MNTTSRRVPPRLPAGARLVLPVVAAAAVLGACSNSPAPVSLPSTSAPGPAPSASAPSGPGSAPSGPPSPAQSGAPAATSPATGTPHCDADRLRFTAAGSDGAAGTINVGIRVTNRGPGSCWTYGYPGLQILDDAGRPLPTTTVHGAEAAHFQRPPVAKLPPQRVTLAAGAWGWFDVTYSQVPSPTCPDGARHGSRLAIIAPDTRTSSTIPLVTSACHGDLGVSAVLPASAWVTMAPA